MKSGGPWNLRGLRPEARAAARVAARQSGMSVGEWLNNVIQPSDDADEESWWGDADRAPEVRPRPRRDERSREPLREVPPQRRERMPDDDRGQSSGRSGRDVARPRRNAGQFDDDDQPRYRERPDDDERDIPRRQRAHSGEQPPYEAGGDRRPPQPRHGRDNFGRDDWDHDSRRKADAPRRHRDDGRERDQFRYASDPRPERAVYRDAPPHDAHGERDDQLHLNFRDDDRDRAPAREQRSSASFREAAARVDHAYRERQERQRRERLLQEREHQEQRRQELLREEQLREERLRQERPREERQRHEYLRIEQERQAQQHLEQQRLEQQRYQVAMPYPPGDDSRDAAVDDAIAEITARQRALDAAAVANVAARQRPVEEPAPMPPLGGAPMPSSPLAAADTRPLWSGIPQVDPAPAFDLGGLQDQLREITTRIESLRPNGELEKAINGLRADLAEIGRSFTEALPRRALESLEIEIKGLAERIDHTKLSGADTAALAGIERGLADVREAVRALTPAEALVGFDEAVKGLAGKVDAMAAKNDPSALQQLEAAIGGLREVVSHVASNDALAKVAEDVRALSAKVDILANSAPTAPTIASLENRIDVLASALAAKVDGIVGAPPNLPALATLENRIDVLASALNASTEVGHAVPRELEKLLSGLIEKLERVQLTQSDHTAMAALEDRIATLVKRLDASDSRFGLLEGVERGLTDLLVHVEQLRNTKSDAAAAQIPAGAVAMEHDVAEIRQVGLRTQDSLEHMQGTVEHVVDRLAMIESGIRGGDRAKPASAAEHEAPQPTSLHKMTPAAAAFDSGMQDDILDGAPIVAVPALAAEPAPDQYPMAQQRLAAARTPIDPSLPPDHPLEPGSTSGRSRQAPSAADRIAASEALAGSKPPVIPDPGGGKPDFIAAARRAAQAAAAAPSDRKANAKAADSAQPKKLSERLRALAVAAAVVVIVVGGFRIVSRLFEDGSNAPPQTQTEPQRLQPTPQVQTEPPRTQAVPPQAQPEPSPAPKDRPRTDLELSGGKTNAASLPAATPLPLPGSESGQNPATVLPASPNGVTPPPGQQSRLNNGAGQYVAALAAPSESKGKATADAVPGAPLEITGSVPSPNPQRSSAAAAGADKLPQAIGGPGLRLAALAGDPAAAYEVGVRFTEGRTVPVNNEEAARWFEIAAKRGLAPAQFRLGSLYEKGLGVKKDLAAARDFYRAAADKGHAKAMHNLAVLYAEGGVDGKADYQTAAQWFRKAADHGVTDSQYNLAVLYARGVGVAQNLTEAYKWFFLAAKEGDQDSAQKRDDIASRLDPQTLASARAAAEQWAAQPLAAEANTVKGAWDAPTPPKPKAKSARAATPDTSKVN